MSISSEITSIGENLKKDYQSIANLGADLTNVDKNIENIAELLDGVYDRLPKTEFEEGESVTLENTLKGKLDYENGVVGIGQSSQESTKGYNLLPKNAPTTLSANGLTCTIKEDGKIILNGTTTALTTFYVLGNGDVTQTRLTLPAGTYTGTLGKDVVANNRLMVNIMKTNNTQVFPSQLRWVTYETITLDEETYVGNMNITALSDTTFNNYELDIMILSGTYTSSNMPNFEKYTGGYSSPSPNWEQEVKCVAGRNKLPTHEIKKFTASADAWCSLDGISNFYNQTNIAPSKVFCNLKANQTYTISVYQKANTNNVQLVDYTGTVLLTGIEAQAKQYTPSTDIKVYPRLKVTSSNTETYCYMQIEEGTQATPYLPYNTIEEVVSGKNILGSEIEFGGFNDDGTPLSGNSTYRNATPILIEPNKQYIFSINGTAKNINKFYYDRNMNLISKESNVYPLITTPNNAYYLNIYKGAADGNQKWQIVEGTEANTYTLTYEPYITPTSYQLSLGDKKLYDECYIVGSPDNWKYVDKLKYIKVTSDFTISKTGSTANVLFNVQAPTITNEIETPATNNTVVSDIYCNIAKGGYSANQLYASNIIGISINIYKAIQLGLGANSEIDTVEKLKTYFDNNDVYFIYPLTTPIETPITDEALISQLNALYNAHSNNGTTIITSNGNLPMIIKVRGLKGAA